ncbi:pyridoxamine 5'-phosphate oxidase [Pelobium manganitolerans]|uniref:Pyridoxamine 5'-phosphate oxidase n=1 Tax=Pelobium manganitolerans TaxID=1842495 RepID=A0A419S370_9SPHI|nr:pyridoxamine 5'-phosphate oxidase family protein [Pelobium manganitolerans]RKD13741.1 pyridoxamine 5'-phosphate oxidase [Pelobium manganitolerans]
MTPQHAAQIVKLRTLIEDVNVAMLHSLKANGEFYSRPMNTMELDDNANLYFFSDEHTPDEHDIAINNNVSVTYSNPENNTYIALSGKLYLAHDQQKIDQLWIPAMKAWFPAGKQDPKLTLIRVEVSKAEYWNSAESDMVVLFNIIKAVIKGDKFSQGEHERIKFQ